MTNRFPRTHGAHLFVAQSARRDMRSGDSEYHSQRDGFVTDGNVSFDDVPIAKYRNVKTDGFASKKEAKRYAELAMLERTHAITKLEIQPRFLLIPKQGDERAVHYVADFSYWQDGKFCVEDAKGFKTDVYVLKRKLMLLVHGIAVREV